MSLFSASVAGCSLAGTRIRALREGVSEWACVYGRQADPAVLRSFDLLIVDPDGPPPLESYRGLVLAYLSVGQVNRSRTYFSRVPTLGADPNWPDAFRVDLKDGAWQRMIVGEILPSLRRYDGLFLDTVDSSFVTGQKAEMARLVRAIREATNGQLLVVNNPESLLDEIDVDAIVAESLFVGADPAEAEARAARYRGRIVLSLEYAKDPDLVEYARQCAKRHGFVPYVTTPDLQSPTTYHRRSP